jgi:hypothetical protein
MVAEIGLALRLVHDSLEFRLENSFTAARARSLAVDCTTTTNCLKG